MAPWSRVAALPSPRYSVEREYCHEGNKRFMRVKLTAAQSEYLRRFALSADSPLDLELRYEVLDGHPKAIEALRERLTLLLAERGFAEDYSVNDEGMLLEELIDLLFSP
jgi:hypothetical protein